MEDIKERITELYKKMNCEYSKELIQHNLFALFCTYSDDEIEKVYKKQLQQYQENKEHYDKKILS